MPGIAAHQLYKRNADGSYALADTATICKVADVRGRLALRKGSPVMSAPANTRAFLRAHLGTLEHEVFAMLILDNRHRLIEYVELFRGTIDGASVHPREVVKEVLKRNGAAVIFSHNHPSGVAEASQADELITRRLRDALALIDVRVLDHLIIGAENTLSFAERGMI
ncbi:MAG TPA: DNA repair protein RadC [Bryobacteraceae bacterium]|nr:DNA repair protein RadC [Bryobacteraceae bacterium]